MPSSFFVGRGGPAASALRTQVWNVRIMIALDRYCEGNLQFMFMDVGAGVLDGPYCCDA